MDNLERRACPDCGDPGFVNPTTGRWQCGNAGCENTDEVEVGALTVEQQLRGAVEALQQIAALQPIDGRWGIRIASDTLEAMGVDTPTHAGGQ